MANTNFVAISSSMIVMFLLISVGIQPLSAQADSDGLSGCPTGKNTWPELVGVAGCKAAAAIKATNSAFMPVVIPDGTPVPLNYICTRVFVPIAGHQGLVTHTPRSGKRTWPELVGVSEYKAAAVIKATNSAYKPVVIPDGTSVILNYDCTRVFVYIADNQGLVTKTPASG